MIWFPCCGTEWAQGRLGDSPALSFRTAQETWYQAVWERYKSFMLPCGVLPLFCAVCRLVCEACVQANWVSYPPRLPGSTSPILWTCRGGASPSPAHSCTPSQRDSTMWYICFHTSLTQNTTLPPPGFLQVLNYNQPFFKITIIDPLIQPNGGVCCTRLRS